MDTKGKIVVSLPNLGEQEILVAPKDIKVLNEYGDNTVCEIDGTTVIIDTQCLKSFLSQPL